MRVARYTIVLVLLAGLASCGKLIDTPKPGRGSASFARYIAVGGSETSGFADGALYPSAQKNSYPAMLAQQFSLTGVSTISFTQPLIISDSGVGLFNGQFVPKLELAYFHYSCNTDSMFVPNRKAVPVDTTGFYVAGLQPFNNLGIPGLRADEVLSTNLSQYNIFARRMKGDTAINVVNIVHNNAPTFFTVWLGTQDILDYALAGGENATIPSAGSFQVSLDSLLNALTTDSAACGAIANIPDITEFPFFNAIAYNFLPLDSPRANLLNAIYPGRNFNFHVGKNQFVIADASAQNGLRQIQPDEKVLLSMPLDSIGCKLEGALIPMPSYFVLNAAEVARIKQAVTAYNQVIASTAAARHIPVVDLNTLYHSLATGGIQANGVVFTNTLVTGYFFSLDGLNPSYRGNALIANEFIKKINSSYKATIPSLDPTIYTGPLFP